MIPLTTLANDKDPAEEIRQGALLESNGDLSAAFFLLSIRTATILDQTNVLQADREACERSNARLRKYVDEKSWLGEVWDSDVIKVTIFIGGIWLGTRIVHNVN